ncbi:hypothetical protein F3Y22_tig00003967pilonHSYRG00006 [Hibiscus syriacus]|uniref:PORR domain-containing protein n=1 Tax=Hibiscus syriacus TaxID=106335 RepID=A0A6A3CKT2_HIBSY|nr:hypothetical protein F3Y22_tig00003967pilonHSYRG00006 [Hibiscus syriacus]
MITMAVRTRVPHRLLLVRSFADARTKWVRDPYLDTAVEREKNLKEILSLKNQIVSSPSKSLLLSSLSPLKSHFNLPTYTSKLFHKYPSIFSQFQPSFSLPLHVKLTPQAMALHKEELAIHSSPSHRNDTVNRLAKLLMLTKTESVVFWPSEIEKVKDWVETWQDLPYISPYENAFHLGPKSEQAEKWTVVVLHELLWLLVSKKTEGKNVYSLGEYMGFENRFEKAVKHFPGIFYMSNKIRTQTVVLKEAYRKDFLMEKHPLMGMRFRYIHLMNKSDKFQKGDGVRLFRRKRKVMRCADEGEVMKKGRKSLEENKDSNVSSSSEFSHGSDDENFKTRQTFAVCIVSLQHSREERIVEKERERKYGTFRRNTRDAMVAFFNVNLTYNSAAIVVSEPCFFVCNSGSYSVRFFEQVLGFVLIKRLLLSTLKELGRATMESASICLNLKVFWQQRKKKSFQKTTIFHSKIQCSDMKPVMQNFKEMKIKYRAAIVTWLHNSTFLMVTWLRLQLPKPSRPSTLLLPSQGT